MARKTNIREDPPLQELHHVEWRSNDSGIITQSNWLWNGHTGGWGSVHIRIVLVQSGKYTVLALDLVSGG